MELSFARKYTSDARSSIIYLFDLLIIIFYLFYAKIPNLYVLGLGKFERYFCQFKGEMKGMAWNYV